MKKPNLFIVGFPRSGTGFLNKHLGLHPDVFMSSPKEPNFFCSDFHNESDKFHGEKRCFPYRTKKDYLLLFSKDTSEKIVGEASTHYIFSKVAAKKICEFNPNAKIIICLRNPVDFLYSLHESYFFSPSLVFLFRTYLNGLIIFSIKRISSVIISTVPCISCLKSRSIP